ncbi:hypothetical protein OY671_012653, partial [Metschnikowia pulcherrima]
LAVAAELFAAQGYAATSMEQVAEICKAGKDTSYRRYASKAASFGALMDTFRGAIVEESNACMAEAGAPEQRSRRYARALSDINSRPQSVASNRVASGEALPAKGVQPTPGADDPFSRRLADMVTEAQAAGTSGGGDAAFIAEQSSYAT